MASQRQVEKSSARSEVTGQGALSSLTSSRKNSSGPSYIARKSNSAIRTSVPSRNVANSEHLVSKTVSQNILQSNLASSSGSVSGLRLSGRSSPSEQRMPVRRSQSPIAVENVRPNETFPMSESRFQRRVLFLLTDMRRLLSRSLSVGGEPSVIHQCGMVEELLELNDKLKSDEAQSTEVLKLSRVGAGDAKQLTYAILRKFMTHEVMTKYSLKGRKGMLAFEGLELFKILTNSVQKAVPECTEAAVRRSAENCFKYAPYRLTQDTHVTKE